MGFHYKRSFNVSEVKEENAIVTSNGRFVVAWDFNKIKKGRGDSYVIKRHVFFDSKMVYIMKLFTLSGMMTM